MAPGECERWTGPAEQAPVVKREHIISKTPWSLQRITAGSSWIPAIDGLRFIAISLVVLFHLSTQLITKGQIPLTSHSWYRGFFALLAHGDVGVRIFFVISGFILGRPFARHYLLGQARPSLRSYYLRRLTRLEPPYLINIAVCTFAIALYLHQPLHTLLPAFAASAVYMHGMFFRSHYVINPVAWTLEMEVQFYILVPLLTTIFRIRQAWLRRGLLLAICVSLHIWVSFFAFKSIAPHSHFWATVIWWLQYFLAGMLLSDLYVADMPNWQFSWRWDLISGIAWYFLLLNDSRAVYLMEPLLIAIAFLGAFRGVLLRRVLSVRWLAIIGGMCYTIYLWHFFIIALIFKVSGHITVSHDLLATFLLQCLIVLPCILAFSVAYFVLIERPCMDPLWPQKLWHAARGLIRSSRTQPCATASGSE